MCVNGKCFVSNVLNGYLNVCFVSCMILFIAFYIQIAEWI